MSGGGGAVATANDPPHIPSLAEWEQQQYAPHRLGQDPKAPAPMGRIPTLDEWQKMQASSNPEGLTFPTLPKIASDRLNPTAGTALPGQYNTAPSPEQRAGAAIRTGSAGLDVAANAGVYGPGGGMVAHGLAAVGRQAVAPAVENPALTAAMMNPVGAAVGAGMAVHTIAKYGWQQAHEMFLSPEDKAKAEADPDHVSGEAALVQAVMLGLGTLAGVHAADRGLSAVGDVSEGVTLEGAKSLHPLEVSNAGVPHSPEGAAARDLFTHAHEPLAVPAVPTQAGRAERAPFYVPKEGQAAEESATVPTVGKGKEATALTEEQRSGKALPTDERFLPQTHSTEESNAITKAGLRRGATPFFETPKGAEILGTAAAHNGMPETAAPYPPGSPLETAWVQGHSGTEPPAAPAQPEGAAPPAGATQEGIGQGVKPAVASEPTPATEGQQGRLASVEGTGETKTRGVSASVEAKAVENKLGPLGELPQYRTLNMADQATKSVQFLDENPELARKVAMGEAPAPEGIHPEFVHIALENRATAEGDVATIRDLASSKLAEEGTTMGQRIAAYSTRDAESPVRAIQDIEKVRSGGGTASGQAVEGAASDLQKATAKAHPDVLNEDSLTKLINSLRC